MSSMPVAALSPAPSGRLVATDGRELPFLGSDLAADAAAGLARVVLRQTFRNPYDQPLRVTYQVPLPADAAVSGFAFEFAGRRVVGVVDRKAAARERFEQALVEGRTAALLEQDRSSLFTQEVGNIPAGADVVTELVLDQPLIWLPEGCWEWRFPTTVAPRYLGEEGRVPDALRVAVDLSETPMTPTLKLSLHVRDAGGAPTSPSHDVFVHPQGNGSHVGLGAEGGARLDRDVVVRWQVAGQAPQVALDVARPDGSHARSGSAFGRVVLVPPLRPGRAVSRDLVILMDTSGSMSGEPLAQARAVVSALIGTLGDRDTLDLVEFSTQPRRWKPAPVAATAAAKAEALAWVGALRAGGGTEMRDGILAALQPLRAESQRQVILVTDGLIGFEHQIVAAIRERLPAGSRVHTLGIGSSVNRSLTGPAARAGGGVEMIVAPGEEPGEAAARLVARTDAPLVVDLAFEGTAVRGAACKRLPDLFGGAPAQIPVELSPDGGTIVVRGRTPDGPWEQRLAVAPIAIGSGSAAVVKGFARERVEDLEIAHATGAAVDADIERLGLDFQIATRLTSWVAVDASRSVDPGDPTRHERIPHEIPHGTSVEGFGLRSAAPMGAMGAPAPASTRQTAFHAMKAMPAAAPPPPKEEAPMASADFDDVPFENRLRREAPKARDAKKAVRPGAGAAGMAPPQPPVMAPGAHTVKGRIVLVRDGHTVIEFTVDADDDWDPAEAFALRPDRNTDRVIVDVGTTRKGRVRKGDVVRLVLFDAGPMTAVHLFSPDGNWVILL